MGPIGDDGKARNDSKQRTVDGFDPHGRFLPEMVFRGRSLATRRVSSTHTLSGMIRQPSGRYKARG
jgi:hypothetical protein